MRRLWKDPAYKASTGANISKSLKAKYANDPEFAAVAKERATANMTRLHQDPEFSERVNRLSTEGIKRKWAEDVDWRAMKTAATAALYESGGGINSPQAIARSRAACTWIMEHANHELNADEEYKTLFRDTHIRLREEMPYVPRDWDNDYIAYCSQLCTAVAKDSAVRAMADSYMRDALPRWAAKWPAERVRREGGD